MSALEKAGTAWGDDLPDWVRVMAEQCDATNQKKVAKKISYCPAVVNTVLSNTYKGDLTAVQQAVKGAFLNVKVNCPVLGELPAHTCLEKQRQPYAGTNAMRVRLYQQCHGPCQYSRENREVKRAS